MKENVEDEHRKTPKFSNVILMKARMHQQCEITLNSMLHIECLILLNFPFVCFTWCPIFSFSDYFVCDTFTKRSNYKGFISQLIFSFQFIHSFIYQYNICITQNNKEKYVHIQCVTVKQANFMVHTAQTKDGNKILVARIISTSFIL